MTVTVTVTITIGQHLAHRTLAKGTVDSRGAAASFTTPFGIMHDANASLDATDSASIRIARHRRRA